MEIVHVDEKEIKGLSVRTTNANEMNPQTSKIAGLWQDFENRIFARLASGAQVYAVYYNYASDADGEFTVLAGTDQLMDSSLENIEQVDIQKGKYMIFPAVGEMPQIVIDTWARVWDHFSNEHPDQLRAYTTDFELYKSENEIEIHIAIK